MALTGRAALLAALGSLPVGLLEPSWTGLLAVNGSLGLACALDYALAAPVRTLRLARTGDTTVRLGETADVHLTLTNPGTRRLRAHVRDAWPPAAGPPAPKPPPPATRSPSPQANAAASPPACAPPGAATAARPASPSAPTARSASSPARAPTPSPGRSASCRRSPAASTCRPAWHACGNSTAAPAS